MDTIRVIEDGYEVPELASLRRSDLVDGILSAATTIGVLSAGLIAPNIVQALDTPLKKLDKSFSKRRRKREIMKTVYYMKSRGYLAGDYEHGLQLTDKARQRLKKVQQQSAIIVSPEQWDSVWRIVIYDIPETHRSGRIMLAAALRRIGCFQLQKSTWISPFDCRDIVAAISAEYGIDQYVTYLEARYLDNPKPLIRRFAKKYPATKFD